MKQAMVIIGTLVALLCAALPALANTLTVTPNIGAVMIVADEGVEGAVRVDLTLSFSSAFKEPRVIAQGGDVFTDQSSSGLLQLRMEREMPDAAFVLMVEFGESPEGQNCSIGFVAATYTYADGRTASPRVIILPPPDPPKYEEKKPDGEEAERNRKAAETAAAAASTPGGSVPVAEVIRTVPAVAPEAAAVKGGDLSGTASNRLEYRECPDVLQRFRDYRGDRSLGSLAGLFSCGNPCAFVQRPAVAISDGLARVVVTLEVEDAEKNPPNLGLSGAGFISLRRDSDRTWSIELLPDQGENEVVLYVITGRVLKRIPLVVAPPLELFMKGLPPEEKLSPLFEYTVAANYLAARGETTVKAGPVVTPPNLPLN